MASQVGEAVEEAFEALDIAEYAKKQRWWNKVFGQSSGPIAEKYSVATQLAIGGATGWCAGFLFKKVGKLAATAVGGGFFLLQIANHTGYIKVDWKRVEKDVNKAKQQLKIGKSSQKPPREVRTKINEPQERHKPLFGFLEADVDAPSNKRQKISISIQSGKPVSFLPGYKENVHL